MGFIGELGLDGTIRSVPGVLSLVGALDCSTIVVGPRAYREAMLLGRHKVLVAHTLAELVDALQGVRPWPDPPPPVPEPPLPPVPDLSDVRGQPLARFALEVAAAGGHHLLFVGPPGAGKTMLARRLPGLLPELDDDTALQATRIHSAAGATLAGSGLVRRPPFRAPHHGASSVSLVGGGQRHDPAGRDLDGCTPAFCSWTSSASSGPPCSTRCGSHSRKAWCAWRGRRCASNCRRGSCSSPR